MTLEEIQLNVCFIKKDATQQLAYGVVLSPQLFDFQKDIILKPEVIAKGAHGWLAKSRKMNLYHKYSLDVSQSVPVESYITTHDMIVDKDQFIPCFPSYVDLENGNKQLDIYTVINSVKDDSEFPFSIQLHSSGLLKKDQGNYISKDGTPIEYVPKDSWFLTAKVEDDNLWAMIDDNRIQGFSIEGRADKRKVQI